MPALRQWVVELTSDGIWAWRIAADPGEPWPDGAPAHTRFFNTAGAQIADIEASEVTAAEIRFLASPAAVADIPDGAKFETFIETDDGPLKIYYGTVIRKQARFYNVPAAQFQARKFEDTLQRTALGARWEPVVGRTRLYNNSAQSLAYGMGPNVGLFSNQPSAVRWHQQLAGDSAKVTSTIVMPSAFGASNGQTTKVICADHNFSTGLGLQYDSINSRLRLCRITSPTTVVYTTATLSHTFASNQAFTLVYNNLTSTLLVYQGSDLTPVDEWEDTTHLVPHGNGYRYAGWMFKPTFLETGPQVSGWAAKDEV